MKDSRRATGMTRGQREIRSGCLQKERSPRKYYRKVNNGRTRKMSRRFRALEVIAEIHLDIMREQG